MKIEQYRSMSSLTYIHTLKTQIGHHIISIFSVSKRQLLNEQLFIKGLVNQLRLPLTELLFTGVKLGHLKNALFGVVYIAIVKTPKSAFFI